MSSFTHTVGKKGGEEFNSAVPGVCLQNHFAFLEPTNEITISVKICARV